MVIFFSFHYIGSIDLKDGRNHDTCIKPDTFRETHNNVSSTPRHGLKPRSKVHTTVVIGAFCGSRYDTFAEVMKLQCLVLINPKFEEKFANRKSVIKNQRTDNTMAERKTMIYKTIHRKLHSLSRVVVPATLHNISVNAHFTRFL